MGSPLPPYFTSLYRLCLRATSAAVLHHHAATKSLRKILKPSFREAAKVLHGIHKGRLSDSSVEAKKKWLEEWNERADNTLSLLHNSAASRGLAHKLTRNLASLQSYHEQWAQRRYHKPGREWDPSLPPHDPRYHDPTTAVNYGLSKSSAKREQQKHQQGINDAAWGALGEVVRLSEGRDKMWLGRVSYRRRKA
ncbi:hypothetical protein GLOTRDRAFT_76713 [Gloeophyllum trabeum ATCC 11539]|uniref:Uncharacterized protein n=1 Tax=Gloeophyllum trabeum (strain ATCC 11539 / FP-39264 / Madison 617) TaxID=670483 RepID=S7Q5L1_GLOTA|nr:uncharacterized protein GLOTRDRAFT_76713 [Gloeophyllum trabeum ATCC 11539]EPQ55341.1 hypothetical protein GLOTRDRAFT_76713 [Gloeophyllum trabeum ATCC 11539]